MGGIALHGAESVEKPFGCEAGVLVLVERCHPTAEQKSQMNGSLWSGDGPIGQLDCFVLAKVPRLGEMESQVAVLRQRTHTVDHGEGAKFVHGLEKATRRLTPQSADPKERSLRIEAILNLHSTLRTHLFSQSELPVCPLSRSRRQHRRAAPTRRRLPRPLHRKPARRALHSRRPAPFRSLPLTSNTHRTTRLLSASPPPLFHLPWHVFKHMRRRHSSHS